MNDLIPLEYSFSGIYLLYNTVNGKRYVGQSQNIRERLRSHKKHSHMRKSFLIYRAAQKYGWEKFAVFILERTEQLDEREQYWLDSLQTFDPGVGYNTCREAGTTRGVKLKLSDQERNRRVQMATERNASSEYQHYMLTQRRELGIGHGCPAKPIQQLDKVTGEIIRIWPSLKEASRGVGVTPKALLCAVNKPTRSSAGYRWKHD